MSKKIDDVMDRLLNEASQSDYFVQNQKGWKKSADAWAEGDKFNYMNMVLKEHRGKLKVGQWTAEEEPMMGSWGWSKGRNSRTVIYMTPFFETDKGVMTQAIVYGEDGEDIGDSVVHPFKATGNPEKDFKAYMSIAQKVLKGYK